ncbi:unnamed protein product [Lactuca saligna]|uniref:Uncharacterized protein n=1 Tax=Lactuca saligna TaxID=75948 RepID=A0AA35ZKB8_LACSI|nr:unnamed protein product [Lactuca saligna]
MKLSGRDEYRMWTTQMPAETSSISVSGKEKVGGHQTHWLWTRSDALVNGWVLGSLSKETLVYVLDRLTGKLHQETNADHDFSAKDVWNELQILYAPHPSPQLPVVEGMVYLLFVNLPFIWVGSWYLVQRRLSYERVTVIDKIKNNGNTTLRVPVGTSKKQEFLEKLLERIPENTQLLDVKNSNGSMLLHVATIIGNTEVADILVAIDPELLAKDNEGRTPLALALSNIHMETIETATPSLLSNGYIHVLCTLLLGPICLFIFMLYFALQLSFAV